MGGLQATVAARRRVTVKRSSNECFEISADGQRKRKECSRKNIDRSCQMTQLSVAGFVAALEENVSRRK